MSDIKRALLLHGLGETPLRMLALEAALRLSGYRTFNLFYPSTAHPVEILAERYLAPAIHDFAGEEPVHVIAHSLGGVLLRYYLQHHPSGNVGRSVMLSPANHGSEIMDVYLRLPPFVAINGPVALQSGMGKHCLPCGLSEELPVPMGIIQAAFRLIRFQSRLCLAA